MFCISISPARTDDDALFYSVRNDGQAFSYSIPVLPPDDGTYSYTSTVYLYMAEMFWNTTDQRIFNVTMEGSPVLENLDLMVDIGAPNTAKLYQFKIDVNDGVLNLDFEAVKDLACVNAISVYFFVSPKQNGEDPTDAPSVPVTSPNSVENVLVARINAGGSSYSEDPSGSIWESDEPYSTGGFKISVSRIIPVGTYNI